MTFFHISDQYNDSYAFQDEPVLTSSQRLHQAILPDLSGTSKPGIKRCPVCRELLDKWNESLAGLRLNKRRYDISSTYDGVTVVSRRFQEVYQAHALQGLVFHPLPDDPVFAAIQATRMVEYDAARRKAKFHKQCPTCQRYESVTLGPDVCLEPDIQIAPNEFVRTDLEFASNDEKSPLLICGEEAIKALKTSKLKGMDIVPVARMSWPPK